MFEYRKMLITASRLYIPEGFTHTNMNLTNKINMP